MLNALLVDDRSAVCQGLKKMIPWDELNARVVGEARNGQEALELAMQLRPDLIITDVRMPVMDGLTLSREIHDLMPDTVVVILSAFDDFEYAQTAIRYGVSDYILKPIDRTKIGQLTEIIAGVSRKRREKTEHFSLLYNSVLFEKLGAALKAGSDEDISQYFESAFPRQDTGSIDFIRDMCYKLYLIVHNTQAALGLGSDTLPAKEEIWETLLLFKTKSEMKDYIKSAFLKAAQLIEDRKKSPNDTVMTTVLEYIREHYTDPNLSVYTIAEKMKLTPNYTSSLFRQMTGENLSIYITNLRMAKAKELIRTSDVTVAQIAKETGYTDGHYFARVFKKTEGLTPSEFRKLLLQGEMR